MTSSLTPRPDAAQDLVGAVRDLAPPAGTHPLVGGTDAELVDTRHSILSEGEPASGPDLDREPVASQG
ncbi:hypothetical protein [Streptomyces sp. NPDC008139]|uniref:hypothetical protein n=1 Tax=Streptomyces sp. NPDC008139 TaxID=3364814 RepID=UPI0036E34C67